MKTITYVINSGITSDDKESAEIVERCDIVEFAQYIEFVVGKVFGSEDIGKRQVTLIDDITRLNKSKADAEVVNKGLQVIRECVSDPDKNPVVQLVEKRASGLFEMVHDTEQKLFQTQKEIKSLAGQTEEKLSQWEQKIKSDEKLSREKFAQVCQEVKDDVARQFAQNQEKVDEHCKVFEKDLHEADTRLREWASQFKAEVVRLQGEASQAAENADVCARQSQQTTLASCEAIATGQREAGAEFQRWTSQFREDCDQANKAHSQALNQSTDRVKNEIAQLQEAVTKSAQDAAESAQKRELAMLQNSEAIKKGLYEADTKIRESARQLRDEAGQLKEAANQSAQNAAESTALLQIQLVGCATFWGRLRWLLLGSQPVKK
jgi:hypothetical protein